MMETIPIIYLIIVYLTPIKFDMNLFLVFCGVAALFAVLDIFKSMTKSKGLKND